MRHSTLNGARRNRHNPNTIRRRKHLQRLAKTIQVRLRRRIQGEIRGSEEDSAGGQDHHVGERTLRIAFERAACLHQLPVRQDEGLLRADVDVQHALRGCGTPLQACFHGSDAIADFGVDVGEVGGFFSTYYVAAVAGDAGNGEGDVDAVEFAVNGEDVDGALRCRWG